MRRLRRPSSITIWAAIWPLPSISFQVRPAAELQTWHACCGGYCSRSQAAQCCKTSRLSLTASQKGLLNSSATGISFGTVSTLSPSEPLAVDRILAADELDIGRAPRPIDVERPLERRDDFSRLAHPLGVKAEGADHFGHIHLVGPQHPVGKGIMTGPPEAGPIAGKAAIADVHDGDPELLAQQDLKIAEHVAKTRLPAHRHGGSLRERLLGGNRGREAKAERRDIAPAEEAARDQRVEDGAQLVAGVAGLMRHERIAPVEHLHQIAVHSVGVDRRLV